MQNSKVNFIELTQQEYDESKKHSNSAFYFCTDTSNFYKGDVQINSSGGGGEFVVTYTENGGTITADKTFNEIMAAIEAKMNVRAQKDDIWYTLTLSDGGQIRFINVDTTRMGPDTYDIAVDELIHRSDETVTELYV